MLTIYDDRWLDLAYRWLSENWFANIVDGFFGFVPGLIRGLASTSAQKEVWQTLHLQRLGRHTLEQQKGFGDNPSSLEQAR
jgi:hypothetical protein